MHWRARYAGPDVRMLAPVLIAVTALLSPMVREAHATTRGRGCHRQGASTFIDTLGQQCASCAPGIIAARKECNQRANGHFDTCKGRCPGFPGRCTITRECVNGCRDQRTGRGGNRSDVSGPRISTPPLAPTRRRGRRGCRRPRRGGRVRETRACPTGRSTPAGPRSARCR